MHQPMHSNENARTKTSPITFKGRFTHSLPDCSNREDDGFDRMPEYEPFEEEYTDPPTVTARAPRPGHEEEEYLPLNVEDIDMCERGHNKWTGVPDTTYDNKALHHTKEYDNPRLVVRRGQEFFIRIRFCRDFYPDYDDFQLEFLIGNDPTPGQQLIQLLFGLRKDYDKHTDWSGRTVSVDGGEVTLGVTPSANAIVGRFKMYVAIAKKRGMLRTRRDPTKDLYVLFNAWCTDDPVYLEDEVQRQEYVLEDGGTIYQGDPTAVSERSWMYGQFELGVLDACIYTLDSSQMLIVHRADPVKLVRKGSAMLNSQDDNGVLVGNWSDDYSEGVAPTLWTGSVKILLQYAHTGIPVCYAQCWVFAGVFNTFLRCLGIPARVITNFSSAHDNTGNLKTDLIFMKDGSPDKKNTRDSIWNYHCWNEVWMARHDLGEGLGGWQAVDATPQETSDGHYRCGPASVRAIKDGLMSQMYDAAFVFAEVNSDLVFRKRDKYGLLQTFRVDKTHIGHVILTKDVGWDRPHDITHSYKYHEGCKEDIVTMARAEQFGLQREIPEYLTAEANVSVKIDCTQVGLGEGFTLGIDLINDGNSDATASFTLIGRVVFYTGVVTKEFKDHREPLMTVPANTTHRVNVNVEAREYMSALGSQVSLQFVLTGQASHQYLSCIRVITLKTPPLTLELSGVHKVGYEMYVSLKFTNPLGDSLLHVWVAMEGPGLMVFRTKYYKEVAPYATLSWTEGFIPRMGGKRRMMAALDCDKLRQVWGVTSAEIEYD